MVDERCIYVCIVKPNLAERKTAYEIDNVVEGKKNEQQNQQQQPKRW